MPRLLSHLATFTPRVVEHASTPPNPWAGYQACLTGLPDCSHVLIVQDDAVPVPGFAEAVERIAVRWPDNPVCLWMSAIPAATAARARKVHAARRYVPLGSANIVPLVAVLWPVDRALEFARWAESASRLTRADDGNAARWMRQTRQEFMVTVPSLVEHDDFTPTVKGGTRRESHGRSRDRVALMLAADARDYDW